MSKSLGKTKAFRCEYNGSHDIRTAPLTAIDPQTGQPKFSDPFYAVHMSMCNTHGFPYKKNSPRGCSACVKAKEVAVKNKAIETTIAPTQQEIKLAYSSGMLLHRLKSLGKKYCSFAQAAHIQICPLFVRSTSDINYRVVQAQI